MQTITLYSVREPRPGRPFDLNWCFTTEAEAMHWAALCSWDWCERVDVLAVDVPLDPAMIAALINGGPPDALKGLKKRKMKSVKATEEPPAKFIPEAA